MMIDKALARIRRSAEHCKAEGAKVRADVLNEAADAIDEHMCALYQAVSNAYVPSSEALAKHLNERSS